MSSINRLLFSALLAPLAWGPQLRAAEFEVLDRFSVDGYSVFRGSADIPGGSFAVGGSALVVKDAKVGVGTAAPGTKLDVNGGYYLQRPAALIDGGNTLGGAIIFANTDLANGANGYLTLSYPDTSIIRFGTAFDGNLTGGVYRDIQFGRFNDPYLTLKDGGNIGIGTTAPASALHVAGNITVNSGSQFTARYSNSDNAYSSSLSWATMQFGNNGLNTIAAGRTAAGGYLRFVVNNTNSLTSDGSNANGTEALRIAGSGYVGIGTTNPGTTLDVGGTAAIRIPAGTTAERPSGAANGMLRLNTTTGKIEYYNGGWNSLGAVAATGGTVTDVGGYRIHTFTVSGTFTVASGGNVEILVVAGGGGGGQDTAGGGGAGGLIYYPSYTVIAGAGMAVTVGNGGARAYSSRGYNGQDSVFGTLTAIGGGGGAGSAHTDSAGNGGSGGGGGANRTRGTGTSGQGYNGEQSAGAAGGGGAGEPGGTDGAGYGGDGLTYSISGSPVIYAGGGAGNTGAGGDGGGGTNNGYQGSTNNGVANTGGGGCAYSGGWGGGGNGGSGIVIIRYPN